MVWWQWIREEEEEEGWKETHFVKREQSIDLHDGEIISKRDECGDVDDVLWPVPEMGHDLERSCCGEPDDVRRNNVPIVARKKSSIMIRNGVVV